VSFATLSFATLSFGYAVIRFAVIWLRCHLASPSFG